MNEHKIVETIIRVTGSKAKVMFNTPVAMDRGPYFGLYPIPFMTMFQTPVPHVGLPTGIVYSLHRDSANYAKRALKKLGVRPNDRNLVAFVILHEFGHAEEYITSEIGGHEFFERLIPQKNAFNELMERKSKYYSNPGKAQLAYTKIPTEKYAMDYAKKHIKAVSDKLYAIGV